jgi:hypothetical protein
MRKPSCLGEGPNHEVTALGTPVPQRSKAARFRIALHISSLDDAGLLANYKEPLPHAIHGGWDTWWVWDARLTSVLLLFLIYLGLVALWLTIEDPGKAARAAAIFTLVGAVNIPIIKFSVDWWNTLHQPASVFRLGGPSASGYRIYQDGMKDLAGTSYRVSGLQKSTVYAFQVSACNGDRESARSSPVSQSQRPVHRRLRLA